MSNLRCILVTLGGVVTNRVKVILRKTRFQEFARPETILRPSRTVKCPRSNMVGEIENHKTVILTVLYFEF